MSSEFGLVYPHNMCSWVQTVCQSGLSRHTLLFSTELHEMVLRTYIINDDWCHAGVTAWTLYQRITALSAHVVTCMSIVCGLLLSGQVYVMVLRQVCQCLCCVVHFPLPSSVYSYDNFWRKMLICMLFPTPTPTPTPHACTHTHVCVGCFPNCDSAQYFVFS